MKRNNHLKNVAPEELLWELRRREALANPSAVGAGMKATGELVDHETDELVKALRTAQKVIYGVDDRQDLFAVDNPAVQRDADAVVALFDAGDVRDNGDGTSRLQTSNFGAAFNLCASEPFRDQPIGAFCSGFLVAPDVVVTAGHCVRASRLPDVRFVFGFRMTDQVNARTIIDNGEIYRGAELIGWHLDSNGADWSVVRLDRVVPNHAPVRVRLAGRVPNSHGVHVIGHPSGLPTKYAPGANVRDNNPSAFFVANLDTYGGNSGSPVFNSETHVVEGVLVRGEVDFVSQGDCQVSMVFPSTGGRGEDCTRTTEFAPIIPGYRVNFAAHSRQVLDVHSFATAAGAPVIQWPFHGGDNQQFRIEHVGGGDHRIVANHSGMVLDVEGFSTAPGARIIQWEWHGGDNQRFLIEPVGDGRCRIIAKHSGKVLDVSAISTEPGAQIIQWDWHGGDNQRWTLDAQPVLARHSGMALDVQGFSTEPGAPIIQWPFHGGDNQQFRIEPVGDGCYRVMVNRTGKVLDVEGFSTASGARIIQWDWHGGDNQRFHIEPVGDGYCRIVARHSGKVLDVNAVSTEPGAQIIQWDWHGGDNQRWRLGVW